MEPLASVKKSMWNENRNPQARHKSELQEFQEKLISKPLKPKFSKELLNLRKIQGHLAKQKE